MEKFHYLAFMKVHVPSKVNKTNIIIVLTTCLNVRPSVLKLSRLYWSCIGIMYLGSLTINRICQTLRITTFSVQVCATYRRFGQRRTAYTTVIL